MIEIDVFENYRTFDDPDEITYMTDFVCTVCGKQGQNYIDVDNMLICKGCLTKWIDLLNNKHLDHIERVGKE